MVATPIGNLKDITLRAIETLKACSVIACEDTRHTRILLDEYGIQKKLLSCRARNEAEASEKIIALLAKGEKVAYVSDAGTPGVSDPGSILVAKARAAGHRVTAIPGVSALTALISVCGLPFRSVLFEELCEVERQLGLDKTEKKLHATVGRELTKIHEELIAGNVAEVLQKLQSCTVLKGEFCVFVTIGA